MTFEKVMQPANAMTKFKVFSAERERERERYQNFNLLLCNAKCRYSSDT